MTKQWVLTEEAFNKFLAWLDPDREKAAEKYEIIRHHLVVIFACKGCVDAEELADETINRVIRRVQQMADTYEGEPTAYFITVAHNLYRERLPRIKAAAELDKDVPQPEPVEPGNDRKYECLDHCMQSLSSANRDLVLAYYHETKRAKIDNRKELAKSLGIAQGALRLRAHRIRASLEQCIEKCLGANAS